LLSILWALHVVLHAENKVMVMPPLDNPRWERFAQELAKGQSQTGAYLAAGYKGAKSPTTAASRLLTNVRVAARVKELQQRGAERAEVTVASLIADLDEDRKLARGAGQASAAVAATMAKAKLLGLFIDRKEVGAPGEFDEIENMSADELREFIHSIAAQIGGGDDASAAGGEARPPRGKPN
jgi:Terminase small subunit